jgi:GntR family transcriptional regulator
LDGAGAGGASAGGASAGGAPERGPRRGPRVSPLYQQVYVQLRSRLSEGAPDPRVPLPSEPALARAFGVSRITIRRTLEQLAAEGLIRRLRGRGTFPVPPAAPADRHNISGYLENLITHDRSTTAVNLSWQEMAVPEPLRAALGDGRCLRIERLRSHEGQPVSHTTLHVPERHARHLDPAADASEPVVRVLERMGVIAERNEQAITARAAGAGVARMLGVAEGTPLICMRRLMLAADFAPVLHQESLYAPDRFEYRMILTRGRAGAGAVWAPIA